MIEFYVSAAVLLLLALFLVTLAFRRQQPASSATADQAQRAFYRQRRDELARERESQWIDEDEFRALELDLERQLLSESGSGQTQRTIKFPAHRWAVVLLFLLLAIAGSWLYQKLGAYNELALYNKQQELAAKQQWTADDIEALKTLTARSLAQRPDKPELLWLQSRLHMELGDYPAAAKTYERLAAQVPESAAALAQWAQALYLVNQRQMNDQIRSLLDRSLAIEPRQATALGMLGIDAFSRGEFLQAIDYWQRLQSLLPQGSTQLAAITEGLQRAKVAAYEAGDLQGLAVDVEIAESLAPAAEGWLFVFAKASDGTPLPVAVARMPVMGSWPRRVILTDADAMVPTRTLSQFDEVSLTARVSRSGNAMAQSGDLEGFLPAFSVASGEPVANIVIDRRHP